MSLSNYKFEDMGDGFYAVRNLPIFETHNDPERFKCDEAWMKKAIQVFQQMKESGYRPGVIIGHNKKYQTEEKPVRGFLDNMKLLGSRLYADIVRIPKWLKEQLEQNAYPNRSVEVLPQKYRILNLALLGGTPPHFPLPQLAYHTDEESVWIRSPHMSANTPQLDYSQLGTAVAQALQAHQSQSQPTPAPQPAPMSYEALADMVSCYGTGVLHEDEDGQIYCLNPETQQYAGVGAAAAKLLRAGKTAATKTGKMVGKQPLAAAVAGGAGVAGAMAGRATAQHQQQAAYAIDEETGQVFYEIDGEMVPIGQVMLYGDEDSEDLDYPINPHVMGSQHRDQGGGSPMLNTQPAPDPEYNDQVEDDPDNPFVDELVTKSEDSDQFAAALHNRDQEFYSLQREVHQLRAANNMIQAGRRAEHYHAYLQDQKKKGAPLGDISATVDYLMSQTPEQVQQFKKVLESAPKISLGSLDGQIVQSYNQDAASAQLAQDYQSNRATYQALGVDENDLKYASLVRHNGMPGEAVFPVLSPTN